MNIVIKDLPTGGGGWLKPEDYVDAEALLIEVKDFEHQRPGTYGPKDSVTTDLTIWRTLDGEPEVRKGTRIEYTVLTADLKPLVGSATIAKLAQRASKKAGQKPAWVWESVSPAARKVVLSYVEQKKAEAEAALADAPDFD